MTSGTSRVVALVLAVVGCNSSPPESPPATCVLRAGGGVYDCVSPMAGSYDECGPDSGQGAACQGGPSCVSCIGSQLGNQAVLCSCLDGGFEGDAGDQPTPLWNCTGTGYSCQ
jgi:hypothetical protein